MMDERALLLAEVVPIAQRLAAQHCRTDPRSGQSCALHHGTWPCMRLLELVGSPGLDADFFRRALTTLSQLDHQPRMLLSGASDHGFLELVLGALQTSRKGTELHLVDRCETPLLLNRWYAARVGAVLHTVQSDILNYAPDAPFDVIGAHAFIDQLPTADWPALIERWRRALAPGGRVIALNRVRSEAEATSEREASREMPDFPALIERVNEDLPDRLRLAVEPLLANLRRYWEGRVPTPFRSAAMVRELFERGHFTVESCEEGFAEVRGRAYSRSRRLRIVARKS